MRRGRKRKYPGGGETRSFYLPLEVTIRLDTVPDASEFVTHAIMVALNGIGADVIDYRKKETRAQVRGLKEALLEAEKKLMALEEQDEALAKVRVDSTDARLRFLEAQARVKRTPPQLLSWLESRSDVLAECDFKSAAEALAWLTENAGKVTR